MRRIPVRCAGAVLLAGILLPWLAAADGGAGPWLLGDWGGAREALHDRGADFSLEYDGEFAYAAAGGTSHSGAYADQLAFAADVDFGKLAGARGSSFHLVLTDRNGSNLSSKAGLGTLLDVQEIYGRGSVTRWTQFYFEQSLLQDRVNLALGRLGVSTDFMAFSCEFMNLGFCSSQPGNVVSTIYNWPVSQWAARLRLRPAPDWYATLAAYQVNPSYLDNATALHLDNPGGTTGMLNMAELGWTPKLGPAQLPGTYAIGGWRDSSKHGDAALDANGRPLAFASAAPRQHGHAAGLYLWMEQQITRESQAASRGLKLFGWLVEADRSTTRVDELAALGLFYFGLLDSRPQDEIGFAVGRSHVNGRIAAAAGTYDGSLGPGSPLPVLPLQGSEYPFELFYGFNLKPSVTLRPDLQYIHTPGGTAAHHDDLVLGMKFALSF